MSRLAFRDWIIIDPRARASAVKLLFLPRTKESRD
jgi:hypothetical protein